MADELNGRDEVANAEPKETGIGRDRGRQLNLLAQQGAIYAELWGLKTKLKGIV